MIIKQPLIPVFNYHPCKECDGRGFFLRGELTPNVNPPKENPHHVVVECVSCNGEGWLKNS
jgi:uncharacterized protein with PIN domain